MDDYRAASRQSWSSVAQDWAQMTDRIDRQLRAAGDWIIDQLALEPGQRVLELAGGPGTVSLMAARAVSPGGHVIYSDFAQPMVEVARRRLEAQGVPDVEYRVIDAEAIDLPDDSVDAVACRMGFMLMADPAAALRESARVLVAGGRIALAVWADSASNPWAALPGQAVAGELGTPPPPADAPGLWALADEARLKGLLQDAGFQAIRIEKLEDSVEYESAEQWIELTRRLAGPLKVLFANLDEETRGAIEDRLREAAKPYELPDGRISLPEQILVASACVG
ncbi:MAG TPA: class I SAM-dependent methyltransferase [Solirubrobacteraceae bacterium]|nr:class I SAM-dependent methyltransferase [Solirubrobacteraceae bacterium]